jgi:phage terminase large subunit
MKYDEVYHPHEKQLEVHRDRSRFRVLVCGRRFGKTTFAVNELIVNGLKEQRSINWYVAPTYRQAKQIAWSMLLHFCPKEIIAKTNETELRVELYNGSIIELKGADNPDSLRGVGINLLIIDEVASIRNYDWLWQEVLRATLTDTQGRAIFIGTPKGFNHFYSLYNRGQEEGEYKSWRFKTSDNPFINKEEIEKAKGELTPDYFAQEYEADFRKYVGLVYKDFNRETHIIDSFEIPTEWAIYRGIDFGSTNPTACLWIAVDGDDNWFISSEYYEAGQTIDYHAGRINADQFSQRVKQSFGDPSGAQWISEFATRGVYITPANKETGTSDQNWVRYGIGMVETKLKSIPGHSVPPVQGGKPLLESGLPSLFVFRDCENLIGEFEHYRWKEKTESQATDLNQPDMPEKANDHLMDALRYFACSYKKVGDVPEDFNKDNKNWEFK